MKSKAPPEESDDELSSFWLITYSDMTTLLLAFFLLMFSFTLLDETQGAELVRQLNRVESGQERRAPVKADLEMTARSIADQFKTGKEETFIEASEGEVTVVLPSSVTFQTGEATLSGEAHSALVQVARILGTVPNDVRVEGHTDNVPMRGGRFPSNWHLSAARAQSVVRLLMAEGLSPRRLQVVGYGETKPRQPNDTEEGRRANRRIEIKLLRGSTKQESKP